MRPAQAPRASRLFIKPRHSPEQVILRRLGLLLLLIGMVLAVFWWDREGLRDHADGHVSASDVVYFTAVTITTVGYGDIVPVSRRARLIDAVFVTPLRLVIWLIFLGTAYEMVIQRWLENRRMQRIHDTLTGHIILCGYGHSGQSAAREAVARGTPPGQILVLDRDEARLRAAAADGHIGLLSDPTRERDILEAGVARARAVLVCLGRDDSAILAVLTVRQFNAVVRIVCAVDEVENIKLLRQAGADAIVAPSKIGGYLVADSVSSSQIADYVYDLMQSGGRVRLVERAPRPAEIGRAMREVTPGLVVRLIRGGSSIGFWEGERIREHDVLLVIEPNGDGARD